MMAATNMDTWEPRTEGWGGMDGMGWMGWDGWNRRMGHKNGMGWMSQVGRMGAIKCVAVGRN